MTNSWCEHGFTLEGALKWARNGFSPSDAAAWCEANFSLSEAELWRHWGFTPADADYWATYHNPREAAYRRHIRSDGMTNSWQDYGFTYDEYLAWAEYCFLPVEAAEWRDMGYQPREAAMAATMLARLDDDDTCFDY